MIIILSNNNEDANLLIGNLNSWIGLDDIRKEIDEILEKIENGLDYEYKFSNKKLNYVGEKGESIISFVLRNSDFALKNKICSQERQEKQLVSDDVKVTINSAISYTEIPIEGIRELLGSVFVNDFNDFDI